MEGLSLSCIHFLRGHVPSAFDKNQCYHFSWQYGKKMKKIQYPPARFKNLLDKYLVVVE
jgi:hypothetical protein